MNTPTAQKSATPMTDAGLKQRVNEVTVEELKAGKSNGQAPLNKWGYERTLGMRRRVHPQSQRYGKHATQRGQKGAFGGNRRQRSIVNGQQVSTMKHEPLSA